MADRVILRVLQAAATLTAAGSVAAVAYGWAVAGAPSGPLDTYACVAVHVGTAVNVVSAGWPWALKPSTPVPS